MNPRLKSALANLAVPFIIVMGICLLIYTLFEEAYQVLRENPWMSSLFMLIAFVAGFFTRQYFV